MLSLDTYLLFASVLGRAGSKFFIIGWLSFHQMGAFIEVGKGVDFVV
jgi:hypothetical protein